MGFRHGVLGFGRVLCLFLFACGGAIEAPPSNEAPPSHDPATKPPAAPEPTPPQDDTPPGGTTSGVPTPPGTEPGVAATGVIGDDAFTLSCGTASINTGTRSTQIFCVGRGEPESPGVILQINIPNGYAFQPDVDVDMRTTPEIVVQLIPTAAGIFGASGATSATMRATAEDKTWLVAFQIEWRDKKTGGARSTLQAGVRLPR